MRVVVVDDSGIFREGLVALLTVAGVEVVEALASTDGLGAAILVERPDAVILDVRLPPERPPDHDRRSLDAGLRHRGGRAVLRRPLPSGLGRRYPQPAGLRTGGEIRHAHAV